MFFDMTGTLIGLSKQANLLDSKGDIKYLKRITIIEGVSSMTGASFGSSNAACYIESSSGILVGARTGISSLVVGFLFLLMIPLAPLQNLFTEMVTGPILIVVGSFMIKQLFEVDKNRFDVYFPAFIILTMTMLTYSISTGIAFGYLSYMIFSLILWKRSQINFVSLSLSVLFILYLVINAIFIQ